MLDNLIIILDVINIDDKKNKVHKSFTHNSYDSYELFWSDCTG